MAKMRPGEKIKVDFDVSGQPIGANRAKLSSYCDCLVRDPLNAPLYGVKEFSQDQEQNKEKMWKLVLDKFDIGLDDDPEEEKREKRRRERRKCIMRSLNKKYINYRACLMSEYYNVEENDEDRLKEENRPPCVDEKDWEWLVEYFGSAKFQFERDKLMPGLLDLYEETHTRSDKKPITQTAQETMQNEIKQLLEQRKTGETKMIDEEIYAKVKPKRKISARDRGKRISPSVTSLFGSFSEGEKLRKEAEAAKNEANEAKKEAIEANEKNKTLSNRLKGLEKESRAMTRALESFMALAGYKLSDLKMDAFSVEEFDEESNEESDKIYNNVEEFGEE